MVHWKFKLLKFLMDSVLIVLFSKNNYNTDCVTGPRPHAGIRILLKPQTFFIRIGLPSTRTQRTLHISLRSNRFRASSSRKLGREQKKEWRERGRGEKEVTSSSLPFPVPFFFFFAPALTRLETLATQATCTSKLHICETALQGGFFFIRRVWRIHVDIFFLWAPGLANSCGYFFFIRRVWGIHVDFFLSDGFSEFMSNYVIN